MSEDLVRLRIVTRAIIAVLLASMVSGLAAVFVWQLVTADPHAAVIALLTAGIMALGDSLREMIKAIAANPVDSNPDGGGTNP